MAQTKIPLLGTCSFCNTEFDKSKMTVHLKGCKARKAALKEKEQHVQANIERTTLLTVLVEGTCSPRYWMYLEFPALMYLDDIDAFLRDTWLECCDHLSSFQVDRTYYSSELGDDSEHPDDSDEPDPREEALEQEAKRVMQEAIDKSIANGKMTAEQAEAFMNLYLTDTPRRTNREYSMFVSSGKIFKPKQKVSYTYDFGSSTNLNMRLVATREGLWAEGDDDIEILARNVAPDFVCDDCGSPAIAISMWNDGTYCKACLKKHPDLEGTILPIVNSPRVGVCGYSGNADIDISWFDDEDDTEDDDGTNGANVIIIDSSDVGKERLNAETDADSGAEE